MVGPWGTEQPSSTNMECPFGFFGGPRGSDPTTYENAGKLVTYLGNGKTDGEVNEWSLYGLGNSKHPLHLHVFHMQIVEYECVYGSSNCDKATMDEWIRVGDWRDVLPTFEGRIKTRFRVTDFPGETVLHCHFLRHEDLGMMDTVLVVDGYRPGYVPTSAPTTDSNPTLMPIYAPTPSPTLLPVPAPTSLPQFPPSPAPSFHPSSHPSSRPTLHPSPSPTTTFAPTVGTPRPTADPSALPIPSPTFHPSLAPTTEDTVTIAVSLTLSATSAPTTGDKSSLLTSIATQLSVSESSITNFDVTYTAARRLLLSGTWSVSFNVAVSLASTSSTSATDFESFVQSSLSDSSFQTSVMTSIASITSFDSISTLTYTRTPSMQPTYGPTMVPTSIQSKDDDDS
jgi:hypothetical protein